MTYGTETKEPDIIKIAKHLRFTSNYRLPQLYGLPKVHKPEVPKVIIPLSGKEPSFVRNSSTFVNEIGEYHLEPDEVLVSYDEKDLLPSLPISKPLDTLYYLLNTETNLFNRSKLNPWGLYATRALEIEAATPKAVT
ncbi:hypothetical protein TTRE_0000873801 [Trichuris trichiura]|uniref:Uncharacterized protein n=1 Tax=Trichuris trichiura TaxID=36087 RepID=A0A077ZIX7_TRITR|nr:hypothetical protein TTRE_0000873801 [Trichuris trichiura]